MMRKNSILILILASIPGILLPNSPFGLGQNMKKPDFAMPDKKDKKKGPHKNKLALKPYGELKYELAQALEHKDYETATKLLDAMRMVCTDTEELKNILLQLADLYYTREDWAKAERAYQEFAMLYPGAQKCDYAHFRAVACGFKLTKEPDRDQTKTQEVLKFADEFMTTHKTSAYLSEVTSIATECREKLLASDVNVFNFYMNNKNYKSAQKRLDIISKEHMPQLASAEPKTLELTIQLAQAQNNPQNLLDAQFKLVTKYPDIDITKKLIAEPEQVKLAWETKYKIIDMPGLPGKTALQIAVAEPAPEKELDLKSIAQDPLKPVEQSKVKVAQAKTKTQSA
jgi:outer membrane assembly lipoprotein YfiO